MGYPVFSEIVAVEGTPGNVTIPLPLSLIRAGDVIVIAAMQDNATGFTGMSGYTARITFGANAGVGMQVWTKIAGSSESDPNVVGVADDWAYEIQIWRDMDVDDSVPVTSKTNWTNTATATSASVNTTADNMVVLDWCCGDSTLIGFHDPDAVPINMVNVNTAAFLASCYKVQRSQGPVAGVKWYFDQADEGGNLVRLALRNKTNGSMPPSAAPFQILDPLNLSAGMSVVAPNVNFSTIDGTAVDTSVTVADAVQAVEPYYGVSYVRLGSANQNTSWAGGTVVLAAPVDLSNGIISFLWRLSSTAQTGSKGAIFVLRDGSGNWVAFLLSRKLGIGQAPATYAAHIQVATATVFASNGTIDWSNIVSYTPLYQRANTTTAAYIEVSRLVISKASTALYLGGSAASPLTIGFIGADSLGTRRSNYGFVEYNGNAQLIAKHHIQIGDGATPTYVDFDKGSIESPAEYSATTQRFWNATSLHFGMKPCAACTYLVRNFILAPRVRSTWRWLSGGSAAATVSHAGAQFTNMDWYDDIGIVIGSAKYSGCYSVQGVAATEWNGCVFEAGKLTTLLTMVGGQKARNCIFTAANASQFCCELTGAGDYYFEGSTFAVSTTALRISATTGNLVLHFALGQAVPAISTAGATYSIDQPTVNPIASITGISANSHIIIHNVTKNTVPLDQKINVTSWTLEYTEGTTYAIGDIVDVYHVWVSPDGSSATKKTKTRAVVGSSGWSVLISEETCPVYAAYYSTYSVTGAAVAATGEFVRDGDNLQIDFDDPDDSWYAYRMFMFDKFDVWNNTGNRAWFLKMTASDAGNIDLGAGSTLDNLNVNTAKQADPVNVTADSGATIGPIQNPTTGGGGITLFSGGKVLTTATGGLAPSEAQIKAWVRAELATELARIDVATSSVAPDNAGITAIRNLVEADEVHTNTTVEKRQKGTSTVLLTKNWTGKPLNDFRAVQP